MSSSSPSRRFDLLGGDGVGDGGVALSASEACQDAVDTDRLGRRPTLTHCRHRPSLRECHGPWFTFQKGMSSAGELNATQGSLLGFLYDGPKTGWDLLQEIERGLSRFWNVTPSHVYRELRTLQDRGSSPPAAPGSGTAVPSPSPPRARRRSSSGSRRSPVPSRSATRCSSRCGSGAISIATPWRVPCLEPAGPRAASGITTRASPPADEHTAAVLAFGIAYEKAVIAWIDDLLRAPTSRTEKATLAEVTRRRCAVAASWRYPERSRVRGPERRSGPGRLASVTGVAVITGGSRGIGAATAVLLAEQGWTVCVGYHADAEAAARVVEECEKNGAVAAAAPVDVTSPDAVASFFAAADRLGPVGALVNNAGIVDGRSRVDEMTAPRLQRMFMVNAVGPVSLCRRGRSTDVDPPRWDGGVDRQRVLGGVATR